MTENPRSFGWKAGVGLGVIVVASGEVIRRRHRDRQTEKKLKLSTIDLADEVFSFEGGFPREFVEQVCKAWYPNFDPEILKDEIDPTAKMIEYWRHKKREMQTGRYKDTKGLKEFHGLVEHAFNLILTEEDLHTHDWKNYQVEEGKRILDKPE